MWKNVRRAGGKVLRALKILPEPVPFPGSEAYWKRRYEAGRNSGPGSYNHLAELKARILNDLFVELRPEQVIEFGCGDGNQLSMLQVPEYLGVDVSPTAVAICRGKFAGEASKSFVALADYQGQRADLCLSLDVIFHLVEDQVFDSYMGSLFAAAKRHVVIYSSDEERPEQPGYHVRHRQFSAWIQKNQPAWKLQRRVPNEFPDNGDHQKTSFATSSSTVSKDNRRALSPGSDGRCPERLALWLWADDRE